MISKLPIILTIKKIFNEIVKNKKFTLSIICLTALCLLIEVGTFSFLPTDTKTLQAVIKIVLRYFLYFSLIRIYFHKKPIFEKTTFVASLRKSVSVIILILATLSVISILYKLCDMFAQYAYVPDFIRNIYYEYGINDHVKFMIMSVVFLISIFSIIIPTFAWVSTIIGIRSSITQAYFKVKDNYLRLVLMFIIYYITFKVINKVAYEVIYDLDYYTYKIVEKIIKVFEFLVRVYMYLNIYKFFYKDDLEHIKSKYH